MKICDTLNQLSTEGIKNVLSQHSHVSIKTIETRKDALTVAQLNINGIEKGLLGIDEIEFIIELSGE